LVRSGIVETKNPVKPAAEENEMTLGNAVRAAAPWTALAAGSALTATIIVVAPEVGREVLLALIGAWTVLAIVRIVVVVGLTRKVYQSLGTRHPAL
jgi:hypothetical protein